jgi:hypothetical protein
MGATTPFRRPTAGRGRKQIGAALRQRLEKPQQAPDVEPPRATHQPYELKLDEDEAALVHYALWLAYGSERRSRSLWQKLREAAGDRYERVAQMSQQIR